MLASARDSYSSSRLSLLIVAVADDRVAPAAAASIQRLTEQPGRARQADAPTVADKRAENAEQLRVAMRKLEANDPTDSAAAQEVAFYQTREAVLAQQEAVEQQIKDLEARKAELEAQLQVAAARDDKARTRLSNWTG